jgi:HlyD family secretion protein
MFWPAMKIATFTMLLTVIAAPLQAEETKATAPAEIKAPSIIVTDVVNKTLVDRVLVTGTVQAVEEVYVQPQVEGLSIRQLNADIGDTVAEGAVLAVLSDDTLLLQKSQLEANKAKLEAARAQAIAQLAEAQANADEAIRQKDRSVSLAEKGTISAAKVEQAQATADAAVARLNSAKQGIPVNDADLKVIEAQLDDIDLRLARTGVKTPVSGVISTRNAKVGSIASGSGMPLFTIIRDGRIELKAEVAENDLLRLAPGQKVAINIVGDDVFLDGTVRRVDPTVNATTRLGSVMISIANAQKARIGMFASAKITIDTKTGPSLPVTSVTTTKGKSFVRMVAADHVKIIEVTTGIQDGEYIEITSGLKAGDIVVAKAGAYVRDGDKITPVKSLQAASN